MSRAIKKSVRLNEIEQLLLSHTGGLSRAEMARRLGVHRSTILRDMADLTLPLYEDKGLMVLDRESYLVNVRFNIHETLAVHLASRLMAQSLERRNPHSAAALRKLAGALEALAPMISQHVAKTADEIDDAERFSDPRYLQVLEKLTVAWAQNLEARIWYRKPNNELNEYTCCPYFIEPVAIGQSSYVIGYCVEAQEKRTFKIERIERIELLKTTYCIPEDFDPESLLGDAWGIWYTGKEPVEVALKFYPRAARRVRETRWHHSEQVESLEEGNLLWRARIAEPQEMLPWIRGWGADVEVLAPESLREAVAEEMREGAALYGWRVEGEGVNKTEPKKCN